MELTVKEERGHLILAVSGRLDAASAAIFEQKVNARLAQGQKKIILDCVSLVYISSAGLRSLLTLAKKVTGSGGNLCLCSLNGMVKEVVEYSGFDTAFPIRNTLQDAMNT